MSVSIKPISQASLTKTIFTYASKSSTFDTFVKRLLQHIDYMGWTQACHSISALSYVALNECFCNDNIQINIGRCSINANHNNQLLQISAMDHSWVTINDQIIDISLASTDFTLIAPEVSFIYEMKPVQESDTLIIRDMPINEYMNGGEQELGHTVWELLYALLHIQVDKNNYNIMRTKA